jgi:hypothetical protein
LKKSHQTSLKDILGLILGLGLFSYILITPRHVLAAALYWYKDGADDSWGTRVDNWWTDSGHTSQSASLPTGSDSVILLGPTAPLVDLDTWTEPASIDSTGLTGAAWNTGPVFSSSAYTASNVGITGNASFTNTSFNYEGTITGSTTFSDYSRNAGTIIGTTTFSDHSYNSGLVTGTTTFTDSSYNESTITGDVTFDTTWYSGDTAPSGGTLTIVSGKYWQGSILGHIYGSDAVEITDYVFNGLSYNNGIVIGSTTFTDSSYSTGNITGTTTFSGYSYNGGNITGATTFTDTSHNMGPITGSTAFTGSSYNSRTITGSTTFSDNSTNSTYGIVIGTTTFSDNSSNTTYGTVTGTTTFSDSSYNYGTITGDVTFDTTWYSGDTAPSGGILTIASDKAWYGSIIGHIYGSDAVEITDYMFTDSSYNFGTITGTTTFSDNSSNSSYGTVIGTTTFMGDLSENAGTITGLTIRRYSSHATTTRDFETTGPWTVLADNAQIDVSGATYDTDTESPTYTTFSYLGTGCFVGGPTPDCTPTSEPDPEPEPTPPTPPPTNPPNSSGGGSASPYILAALGLTPSVPPVPGCPKGYICKPMKNVQLPMINDQSPNQTLFPPALIRSTLTHNLETGNTGPEVKFLQQYLNANGYTIAQTGPGSPGKETETFGGLTRQALIKFQKANGIKPAIGYFGPITRKFVSK